MCWSRNEWAKKSDMVTGLRSLWGSSQYSDMTVRSGTEDFKVHRAILCPRSKFFAAACNGQFQEGTTGIITLEDDDTPTVRRMLEYLYTDDYDDNGEAASLAHFAHGKGARANLQATTVTEEEQLCAHDPPDYSKILNNIAVYAIADKYDIPALQVLTTENFRIALWNDERVLKDLASLPAIIDAVFDTTPDTRVGVRKEANEYWDWWDEEDTQVGIRKQATKYCEYWYDKIIGNEDAITIVRDHGEIGKAMIRRMFRKHEEHERSMKPRIADATRDANTLLSDIQKISRAAKYMKVSDLREVVEIDIDARHQQVKDLPDAIQEAKDFFNWSDEE